MALGLAGLVVTIQTLVVYDQYKGIYRPSVYVMLIGAALALAVGWWAPAPWILALALAAILSGIWLFAIIRWVSSVDGDPGMMPN